MADQSNTEPKKHEVKFPWNEKIAVNEHHYNPIKPISLEPPKKKVVQEV